MQTSGILSLKDYMYDGILKCAGQCFNAFSGAASSASRNNDTTMHERKIASFVSYYLRAFRKSELSSL